MIDATSYILGLLTLPAIVMLIMASRPTPKPGYQPAPGAAPTSPPTGGSGVLAPRADPLTLSVELEGIDAIEANLARVSKAANETAARLREVAELGERIARKPDTNH